MPNETDRKCNDEHVLAMLLHLAGLVWNSAREDYERVSWFRPIRKLVMWRRMKHRDVAFASAMDMYSEFVNG